MQIQSRHSYIKGQNESAYTAYVRHTECSYRKGFGVVP
jgi:hypothetical protein